MKFCTNTISTKSKVTTLSEMFKAAQTQAALTKTASVAAPATVAGKGDFGGKKAPPFGKGGKPAAKGEEKELEADDDDKVKKPFKKAEKEEAESSGQLEPSKNPQNDPKVEDGEKKGGSPKAGKGGGKSGEAESSGQLDVEPLHQEGESTQEKPGDLDTMKEKGEKVAKTNKGQKVAFQKIAELSTKQKEFLRGVWSNFWPKKYIDAILESQS